MATADIWGIVVALVAAAVVVGANGIVWWRIGYRAGVRDGEMRVLRIYESFGRLPVGDDEEMEGA